MSLVSIIPTCYIKQCWLVQVADLKTAHRISFLLVDIILYCLHIDDEISCLCRMIGVAPRWKKILYCTMRNVVLALWFYNNKV